MHVYHLDLNAYSMLDVIVENQIYIMKEEHLHQKNVSVFCATFHISHRYVVDVTHQPNSRFSISVLPPGGLVS